MENRFELFMMAHKLVLISLLPALVSKRYTSRTRAPAHWRTHILIHSATSFLLVAIMIEFVTVLLFSHLRPFVHPRLDRLNMRTLIITCLVLFYGYLPHTLRKL